MKASKILLHALAMVVALGFSALLIGCDNGSTTPSTTGTPSGTPSAK